MPIIAYWMGLKNPPPEEEWQQTVGKAGELCQTVVEKICRLRSTPFEILFYHNIWVEQH